jgi:peptide deformylase
MYNILTIPNDKLRQVPKKIEDIEGSRETLEALCASMFETMKKVGAVGIAANQIGVDMQLAVAYINGRPYNLCNPVIIEEQGSQQSEEGCLSIPGFSAQVTRPTEVTLQWTTIENEKKEERFIGYSAAIIKHELDQLYGKLFIYYLSDFKR